MMKVKPIDILFNFYSKSIWLDGFDMITVRSALKRANVVIVIIAFLLGGLGFIPLNEFVFNKNGIVNTYDVLIVSISFIFIICILAFIAVMTVRFSEMKEDETQKLVNHAIKRNNIYVSEMIVRLMSSQNCILAWQYNLLLIKLRDKNTL